VFVRARGVAELTAEGTIPDDVFAKATVNSTEEAIETARRVGYPIMVKASEGGGGKGIRMCANEAELAVAYSQVCDPLPVPNSASKPEDDPLSLSLSLTLSLSLVRCARRFPGRPCS
jgi:hypothetical protein